MKHSILQSAVSCIKTRDTLQSTVNMFWQRKCTKKVRSQAGLSRQRVALWIIHVTVLQNKAQLAWGQITDIKRVLSIYTASESAAHSEQGESRRDENAR